jgi:hypothetical protein
MINDDTQFDLTGDPTTDWKQLSFVLASTLQSFTPADWFQQAHGDMLKIVVFQTEWLEQRVLPALGYFNKVQSEYDISDPF